MISADLLIFDFDGTLVDTGEDLVVSMNYTLQTVNLPPRDAREIISFVGDGVDKLVERSLGPEGMDRFKTAMEVFSQYYEMHMLDHARVYRGIPEVLSHFSSKKKLIVTNKRYRFAIGISIALGLAGLFDEIIGRDSGPFIKPDPRLLRNIMERYGVPAERTIVIGDGVNDILMAKQAGTKNCAFLNGLGGRDVLIGLGPDITYENPSELIELIS